MDSLQRRPQVWPKPCAGAWRRLAAGPSRRRTCLGNWRKLRGEMTAEYAEAVREGPRGDGVLTWRPIGHCEDLSDPVELRAGLAELYADSPWIDIERIAAEVIDAALTRPIAAVLA